MSAKVQSAVDIGVGGIIIDIECHVSNGLPGIIIVGYASKSIDEAKERVRSAFANSKLELPRKRITLNLAPADIPKDGSSFDIAMATAILQANKQVKNTLGSDTVLLGELSLDGSLRPVRGIIGKLLAGRELGINKFYIPESNMEQAKLVPHISLFPLTNLKDLYLHLNETKIIKATETGNGQSVTAAPRHKSNDFKNIIGQKRAKRALEIAAAGGHNILLNGPPGTGKSMLAKALPSILPPLNHEEILEVTHIHSLTSKQYDHIIYERPFRAPHHSASDTAIIGGGQTPRPGEISLSHHGVLFFDEMPEFSRPAIEALRQPLEDRIITISRAKDTLTFPASFILVATSNPCPCGYYGSTKPCSCLPQQIVRYDRKLSGPILDRIDMYVDVEEIEHARLLSSENDAVTSQVILKRVTQARNIQSKRYDHHSLTNATLDNNGLKKHCQLESSAEILLNNAASKLKISARSYMRAIKVARTIADLENSDVIKTEHISEALQYRRPARAMF